MYEYIYSDNGAQRSYQKDVANLKEAKDSRVFEVDDDDLEKWQYNSTSGYYYNQSNGFYYDTNAGFYYSDSIETQQASG
ncbi:unnamed protein product [Malus baccata var. baccata]